MFSAIDFKGVKTISVVDLNIFLYQVIKGYKRLKKEVPPELHEDTLLDYMLNVIHLCGESPAAQTVTEEQFMRAAARGDIPQIVEWYFLIEEIDFSDDLGLSIWEDTVSEDTIVYDEATGEIKVATLNQLVMLLTEGPSGTSRWLTLPLTIMAQWPIRSCGNGLRPPCRRLRRASYGIAHSPTRATWACPLQGARRPSRTPQQ